MNIFVRIIVPILLLLLGVGGAVSMANSSKQEEKVEVPPAQITVEIMKVVLSEQSVQIKTTGVVQPAQSVTIFPQVPGKVSSLADHLQPGRRFSKGDLMVQIERNDYLLALEQEKSRVRRAELELQIEEKRQSSAQKEWELLGNKGEATELASRRPQLEVAKLNLEGAQASMERAEIALKRTSIRAPFNGIIQKEQVDVGQVVGGSSQLLTIIGTDQYWVRVAIPTSQLSSILIPDVSSEEGSNVLVQSSFKTESGLQERQGKVLRMEAQLDPQSRTAHLLVGIDDPLSGFPIMLGSYVDVYISGKTVTNAVRIPASAIVDGSHVFVADDEDRLQKRDVTLGWSEGEESIITAGLQNGDRVITTSISLPIYGSPLNIIVSKSEGE